MVDDPVEKRLNQTLDIAFLVDFHCVLFKRLHPNIIYETALNNLSEEDHLVKRETLIKALSS